MRPVAKIAVLFFVCMSWAGPCCAGQPVSVRAAVDKKTALIGEKVRYTMIVSADSALDITMPDMADAFKDLNILDSGRRSRTFFGRTTKAQWAIVQTFTPGVYTIPAQEVKYKARKDTDWRSLKTDSQTITVRSLLNTTTALADIKGPLNIRTAVPAVILAALAGIILILVFWKKIFPGKKKTVVEMQPWKAHETAYAQLDALRRRDMLAKGMIKMYYSELSDILRHYLENRFSLKAPEMTTEEFIAYVREYSELGREQKDLLKEFLANCDLVKFAKFIPPSGDGEAAFETVKKFVDQTKAVEAEHVARPHSK